MTVQQITEKLTPFGFAVDYIESPRSQTVSVRITKGGKVRVFNFHSVIEFSKIDISDFIEHVSVEFVPFMFGTRDPLKEIRDRSLEEALKYDAVYPKITRLPVEDFMPGSAISDRIVSGVSSHLGTDLNITQEIKKAIAEEFAKRDKQRAEHLTNREWLMSLTDEEFAAWCIKTAPELPGITDPLMPRLGDLKHAYKDTYSGIIDWLRQPRNIIKEEE